MRLTPLQQEIAATVAVALRKCRKTREGPATVYQDVETQETLARFRPDLRTAYVRDDWVAAALHAVPDLKVLYAAPPPPDPKPEPRRRKPRRRRRGEVWIHELPALPAYIQPRGVLFA